MRIKEGGSMLKDDILKELIENEGDVSGQTLAQKYGVSRNAIWKAVKSLKDEGYVISSVTNKGYRLVSDNNILSGQAVRAALDSAYADMPIYVHESIDSTNNEAKRLLAGNDETQYMLIVAKEQKKGRGRYGHSFYSPKGSGIYMSVTCRISGVIDDPGRFTEAAAVAVIRAVKELSGEELSIRGINDIYYHGKKAGGILTEAVSGLETGHIEHVITGIGLNLTTESFPKDIKNSAISLNGLALSPNNLIARIVNEIIPLYETRDDEGYVREYEGYRQG